MMRRDCPFCGRTHWSAYVDELEAAVMACRDRAPLEYRGSLDTWDKRDTLPIPPEVDAYAEGQGGLAPLRDDAQREIARYSQEIARFFPETKP